MLINSVLEYIKQHKIQVFVVVGVLLFILITVFTPGGGSNNQDKPSQANEAKGDWGKASDLIAKLGPPLNANDSANKDGVFEYKSKSVNRNHEVVFNDNTPLFYKEVVTELDKKDSTEIKDKYGEEEIKLSGPESDIGFNLYAYPSKGIAYVGSRFDNVVSEIWYFAPLDPDMFLEKWAQPEGYRTASQSEHVF